jgi:hypothetical protein
VQILPVLAVLAAVDKVVVKQVHVMEQAELLIQAVEAAALTRTVVTAALVALELLFFVMLVHSAAQAGLLLQQAGIPTTPSQHLEHIQHDR